MTGRRPSRVAFPVDGEKRILIPIAGLPNEGMSSCALVHPTGTAEGTLLPVRAQEPKGPGTKGAKLAFPPVAQGGGAQRLAHRGPVQAHESDQRSPSPISFDARLPNKGSRSSPSASTQQCAAA